MIKSKVEKIWQRLFARRQFSQDNKAVDEEMFTSGEERERLYDPHADLQDDISGIAQNHIDRYEFAKGFLVGNEKVLDTACGSGYGSKMLAEKASVVVGVDISEQAIGWANKQNKERNIDFLVGDLGSGLGFLPDNSFDVIVSFETIEHIANQDIMLGEFKRILRPRGKLIISTPDRLLLSGDCKKSENPFHVKELSKPEFLSILRNYFRVERFYGQGTIKSSSFWRRVLRTPRRILRKFKFLAYLKSRIADAFGLRKFFHDTLTDEMNTPIMPIVDLNGPNNACTLIALCEKNS